MWKRLSVTLLGLLAIASTAQAADKLKLERIDFSHTPTIRMFLTYLDSDGRPITGRAKEDVRIVLDAADQGNASALQTFGDSKEPMNLMVIVQAGPATKDVLDDVKRGVANLADALPNGSKMGLFAYNGDTKRAAEMGQPGDAQSAARTMVADEETVEPRLLDAVRSALDQFKGVPKGQRKLLVIFSDGIDIDMDAHSFTSIGKRAAEQGDEIVIDTIGYNSFDASKLRNMAQLAKLSNGTDRQLKAPSEISSAFNNIADEIKQQYIATFEIALAGGDAKEHQFNCIISAGGREAFSNQIFTKVPKAQHPPVKPSSGTRWWLWILVFVLGVGLLGLIAWLIFRDKPEAMPVEEPAAAPAPAPAAPAGPMKTMALDVGAVGGTPMVGWIVGTSGKYADQTFKLKPSRTVIGTGADCDIKVEDQFMSSKHCEVRFENGMYKLFDLGSTNGIVVNDKKVREHDLVDNDLIRCGRTEFKFKSVS